MEWAVRLKNLPKRERNMRVDDDYCVDRLREAVENGRCAHEHEILRDPPAAHYVGQLVIVGVVAEVTIGLDIREKLRVEWLAYDGPCT